jgi:hypothetical protein
MKNYPKLLLIIILFILVILIHSKLQILYQIKDYFIILKWGDKNICGLFPHNSGICGHIILYINIIAEKIC